MQNPLKFLERIKAKSHTSSLNTPNMSAMYPSLQLPWSESPSEAERIYKDAGLVKTKGTLFMLPPDTDTLTNAYKAPPRPKTRMSSGATALCKHFERGGSSSERGIAHPFWPLPKGSNENKNQAALRIVQQMINDARWRNMMMLHQGVAVYEVRNSLGYGMRWTLDVEKQTSSDKVKISPDDGVEVETQTKPNDASDDSQWRITRTTFRGFLEPIEGMNHELPVTESR